MIPDVHFSVIRVDAASHTVEGFYESSHPYRKLLPVPDRYSTAGEIYYRAFGSVVTFSRLTGQKVSEAGLPDTFGDGYFAFPPDSLYQTVFQTGLTPPEPSETTLVSLFGGTPTEADQVWAAVHGTDIINRLAAYGDYDVVLFDHYYGSYTPSEWIVICYSHPTAPIDAGIERVVWPRGVVTQDRCTAPEVLLRNYSDAPLDLAVRLTVTGTSGTLYEAVSHVGMVEPNAAAKAVFDPFVASSAGLLLFQYNLVNPDGSDWVDAFTDNNSEAWSTTVTPLPVFRSLSPIKPAGTLFYDGIALDFDGDGDFDLFEEDFASRLLRREVDGSYTDVTALTTVPLPPHPRFALARDFNRDGSMDMLIVYFGAPPVLLIGDGTGAFSDGTFTYGLSGVTGYGEVEAIDKELDGDLDLIFAGYGPETVMENDGGGHFTDVSSTCGLIDPGQTEDVESGDINNDGYPDVFLTNWNSLSRLFINDQTGHFSQVSPSWSFTYGRQARFLDYDGDSLTDILFVHNARSYMLRNTGNLQFEEVGDQIGVSAKGFYADITDLNLDGHPDMMIVGAGGSLGTIALLIGQGVAGFVDHSELLVDLASVFTFPGKRESKFADMDEDGDTDIFCSGVYYDNRDLDCSLTAVPETADRRPGVTGFPNPFHPALAPVRIEYHLEGAGPVRLSLFDVAGRTVRTLVIDRREAGFWTAEWDGRDESGAFLPSGVYFFRVSTPARVVTGKLNLVR